MAGRMSEKGETQYHGESEEKPSRAMAKQDGEQADTHGPNQ
jgi:hypothetical protein